MKKPVVIFFLSIYLLSFAEFHHLLRIPVLIAHFEEHKQSDPSISFLSFLRMHYVGEIVIDDDYQRDNELPFREADCCCVTTINFSCECSESSIEIATNDEELNNEFILYNEDNHSLLSTADIFQPPRAA